MFQVHLWVGLILGLYIAAVSVTGAALIFRPEIEPRLVPRPPAHGAPATAGRPFQAAWNSVRRAYPGYAISTISMNQYPGRRPGDPYRVKLQSGSRTFFVYVDCWSGELLAAQHPVIQWVQALHFRLFAGQSGVIANSVGGFFFLAMCVTGVVLWWPGRRSWRRGFTVGWRSRWQNINYDLHGVTGIVTTAPLGAVALAGVYLAIQYFSAYHRTEVAWQSTVQAWPIDLDAAVQEANAAVPGGIPTFLYLPKSPGDTFRYDKSISGTLYKIFLDQNSGRVLRIDSTPDMSLRGWIDKWAGLIHYGRFWGYPSRMVWVVLGLMPPLLFLSGFLMWWNRLVARKSREFRAVRPRLRFRVASSRTDGAARMETVK